MLDVTKDHCSGCGLCAQSCPRGAISLQFYAEIDPSQCNSCGQCLTICPPGAIIEKIPVVTTGELKTVVSNLQAQTDDIILRLDQLVTRVKQQ